MLRVRTYVDRSKVSGLGVFAQERIAAGTRVWEWVDNFDLEITVEQIIALPEMAQQYILHYANQIGPGLYLLCGDNARFMNHADDPNISADGPDGYALREIAAGEEIVCDYREFDVSFKGF